jgi:hypothetical protein
MLRLASKRVVLALLVCGALALAAGGVTAQSASTSSEGDEARLQTIQYIDNMERVCSSPRRQDSAEACRSVEQALLARNYDPGPIDGRWDSTFWSALTRFKRDRGLGGARCVDSATLRALGL